MMIINTRKGFVFLEAVISITILALLLTPILTMQNSTVNRVSKDRGFAQRIQKVENIFYYQAMHPDEEKQKSFDKQYQNPQLQVSFAQKELGEGSVFKRFKNIYRLEAQGTWDVWSGQQQLKVVQLFFDPESEQEDET